MTMTARHHVALRAGHYEPPAEPTAADGTDDTTTTVVGRPPSGDRDVDVSCDICGGTMVWQVRSMNRTRWRRAGWAAMIVAGLALVATGLTVFTMDPDGHFGGMKIRTVALFLMSAPGVSVMVHGIVKLRQEDGTRLRDASFAHYAHPSRRHDGPAAS